MIVFTLDALADDSHRRHLIDPSKIEGLLRWQNLGTNEFFWAFEEENGTLKRWQPDYTAYYEAFGGDAPIKETIKLLDTIFYSYDVYTKEKNNVEIWSSNCESSEGKIRAWLLENVFCSNVKIKLRPIGDDRPQEQLFEMWKNDYLNEPCGYQRSIEMVFSSHAPTINMFRRAGIFVFDCNQDDCNQDD